ncbi:MAG: DUF4139 domain-containing protein [Anaerolineae bacterium]|nr:DUF4139 domain-containing protein [Anaerolineae bacterium]
MKRIFIPAFLLMLLAATGAVHAQEQVTYISQPDELAIFLNNIAFARDFITLAGSAEVQIVLPNEIFQDTLVIQENNQRISGYRINRSSGQVILYLPLSESTDTRTITLDYLMSGITWKPVYNMWLTQDNFESVQLDFSVEIQNSLLSLKGVQTKLVAGRVDTSQQLDTISTVTANQYIAGYEDPASSPAAPGAVTIQHIYNLGEISAEPGDALYQNMLQGEFQARRLLLWNAQTDKQITVIYKVSNQSEMPLPEGTVRSYQDGLFVGSDFIEVTPIGSEGSVTVGGLQDVRVNRAESRTQMRVGVNEYDTKYHVTLSLTNFSSETIDIQVVDAWNPYAREFVFSDEPEFSPDNLLRWQLSIPAGETLTITYEFVVD